MIGKSIGRYHILEQLGEGGMATVYKAFDTRLDREVALKIILPTRHQLPKFLKRFEREAKSLAQLSHPNIVKIMDYGEHEGIPYLVMEYLPGGTLKGRLGKPIYWAEAARLLEPMARALAYAHDQKIVHRDVKPSNILITRSGEPMLSDFGIAKVLETEETWDLTGTGVGIGTPAYMAPEQGLGRAVDYRADIYALGVVLYEMVTGRQPFRADTPMAVMVKHIHDPLPRPRKYVRDLPKQVEQVIFKALAKRPEDRFQGIREFAAAFEGFAREKRVRHAGRAPRPRWLPEGRRLLVGLGTLVVAVLSVAGLIASGIVTFPSAKPDSSSEATSPGAISAATSAPVAQPAAPTDAPLEIAALCEDALGCLTIRPSDPIRLATLLWPGHPIGVESIRAVEMAVEDAGRVLDREIELVGEEGDCTSEGGRAAATKLAADVSIVAVIGTSCSIEARGAALVLDEAGLTMVSPSATSSSLTSPEVHVPSFLRTAASDELQGRLAAEYAFNELGIRTAAVVHAGEPYSSALASVFNATFTDLGGELARATVIEQGVSDFEAELTAISAESPGMIFLPLFPEEASRLVIQARETSGLENVVLVGPDSLLDPNFIAQAGAASEGTYISGPTSDFESDESRAFLENYQTRYGEDPTMGYQINAYDATNMILSAIQEVALPNADGSLQIGRQALRDALYATQGFKGLTGVLNCSPNGDCGVPRFVINQVQGGQYVRVYEPQGPEAGSYTKPMPGASPDSWELMAFSVEDPIVGEVAVRQGIAYAMDRQLLGNEWAPPYRPLVLNSYIRPDNPYYAGDSNLTIYTYDPSRAEAILEGAGWVDTDADGIRDRGGQPLVIEYIVLDENLERLALASTFSEQMQAVGIGIDLLPMSVGEFFEAAGQGNFQIAQFGWKEDRPLDFIPAEPFVDGCETSFIHSRCIPTAEAGGTGDNFSHWRNLEVDSLLDRLVTVFTFDEQYELLVQIQQHFTAELPFVPLFYWPAE